MPTRIDDGPPPSTYAVQIVQNLVEGAKARRPQLSGNRPQLKDLFKKVLDLDELGAIDDETFERNLEINHKLIWTIVKGCLSLHGIGNPFDNRSEIIEQAERGLAVIEVTIRRTPAVLFISISDDAGYARNEGVLFLWLTPCLLTLLHLDHEKGIHEGALKVLKTMLNAQSQSSNVKSIKQPISKYVYGCMDDLLAYLVQIQSISPASRVFKLPMIPSIDTGSDAYGKGPFHTSCRVESDNAAQATSICISGMSLTVDQAKSNSPRYGLSTLRWVVDDLISIRSVLATLLASDLSAINDLFASFLATINITLEPLLLSSQDSIQINILLRLSCQTIGDVLQLATRTASHLARSTTEKTLSISLHMLCSSSLRNTSAWKSYKQYLEPTLHLILLDEALLSCLGKDLQVVLGFVFQFFSESLQTFPSESFEACDVVLRDNFQNLFIALQRDTSEVITSPPAKRQRKSGFRALLVDTENDFRTTYLKAINASLDTETSLPQIISDTLAELPEDSQCSLIDKLGNEACLLADSLIDHKCQLCDTDKAVKDDAFMEYADGATLADILICVIRISQEQKVPRPRVHAMLALRRFLAHCRNVEYLDLKTSMLAIWPIQSLKSSIRTLRIAAVSAIVQLVSDRMPKSVLKANRRHALDMLRSLSEKDLTLQEISIIAYGRIASIIQSEEELNLCLLRLIEYLGHGNPFVANLAYEELQRLCSHNANTAMRLFEPYWRTLAITIVKDLRGRPQICQTVCDLLGISISNFLKMTQYHTIPYLIVQKQQDILRRISEANGPNVDLLAICSNSEQLAVILANILLQPSQDPEATIASLLSQISNNFTTIDPQELLRSDPTRIAFELLQVASSPDIEVKARVRRGLGVLAEYTQRKPSKKYTAMDMFFEENSLGIVQFLSAVISQIRGTHSIGDRRRCVGAIEEMALVAGHHLLNALPQISSCLRSAIEDDGLCNEAFGAWITLMNSIDSEDEVGSLIDPTFAIVAQHWNSFSTDIQQAAHDMISSLIKNRAEWIHDNVLIIPSLDGIPLLAKFESELNNIKRNSDTRYRLEAFAERCRSDNVTVVAQALSELPAYLLEHQNSIHNSVVSEQPEPSIALLAKSLLEICVRLADIKADLSNEAARCLGLLGCLDPTKIELPQENREIIVLSDFLNSEETLEFVVFFLEEVLVKIFLAETDTRVQGLLAYAIQELLKTCGFEPKNTINKNLQPDQLYQRWRGMDETVRDILTPFLTSRYILEPLTNPPECNYPIFSTGMNHSSWLRQIVFDLLGKSVGQNATVIFSICRRIVRRQNLAIPTFLLPYVTLHVVFQGSAEQINQITKEYLTILSLPSPLEQVANESLILCSHDVFRTLDYMSRWLQERKKTKLYWPRIGVTSVEDAQAQEMAKLKSVEDFLNKMPAEIISNRAIQCKSFSRALMQWEAFIRQRQNEEDVSRTDMDKMYWKLQNIYNSIDEPDGIEGISSRIVNTTPQQQMLEHRKAGRWTALQSWYELELNKHPTHEATQLEFLRSLKESGQHDTLINEYASLKATETGLVSLTELVAESAWTTGRWDVLEIPLAKFSLDHDPAFDTGVGKMLLLLQKEDQEQCKELLNKLRGNAVRQLSATNIRSLQSCQDVMFRLQILSEMEELAGLAGADQRKPNDSLLEALLQRVESLGAFPPQQQQLLSVQRALVQVAKLDPEKCKLSSSWLMTAKLARKSGFTHQAFNAIFKASDLNEKAAAIEDARLLWREGHHIKAIQNLKAAIEGGAFGEPGAKEAKEARINKNAQPKYPKNPVAARAHLILAKWIDHAGQSQSEAIIEQYRIAVDLDNRSEKGHYHLGRHYNKLLESEKAKPPAKQAQSFITGEMAKLVLENFLRAVGMGAKYVHETLPRVLTLWLELGEDVRKPIDPRYGDDINFQRHVESQRLRIFKLVSTQMKKYTDRLPAYIFYTAFPQVLARICHPNESIQSNLIDVVAKVIIAHSQQAMWSLLALIKSKKPEDRVQRGKECWAKVQDNAKKLNNDAQRAEITTLMRQGQRLSEQLLSLSNKDLGKRHGMVSLANDLGFSHSKSSHCRLAIPVEAMLTATLPTPKESLRTHKAFPKDTVTIDTFLDEVLVLNSLIKPKKVNIRGSDGKVYGILCKPKDDLRKDQRLLEFNSMITRLLKRDPQSSKRRLYIKTYAVTPLNEECGLIEWVEGCRPLRDILLDIYKLRNVKPDYGAIKETLDSITANRDEADRFESEVLNGFPPVFHEWFMEMFPEPDAWFDARLRYTRSCAVMSMVGHVLGLGDRHGENILFQGENGGTLHVDFNCLFDKGLTFEKPERVPFRLTHNMVDAFGVYGYEGPFRKCCELTLGILRQHQHALMTILETFVHDPTTDFIGKKRKANPIVPDTPEGVLEAIRTKVRGLIAGESVPLSVEGHVQLLIQEATDAYNLAAMYIGWCAFL